MLPQRYGSAASTRDYHGNFPCLSAVAAALPYIYGISPGFANSVDNISLNSVWTGGARPQLRSTLIFSLYKHT
jgi:hypothetical protein